MAGIITYGDIADAGACLDGVIQWCKKHDQYFGDLEELLRKYPDNEWLKKAVGSDGSGSGSGYGYGYGDGSGSGSGCGYGYGDGEGDGYGYGYGDGDGDGGL